MTVKSVGDGADQNIDYLKGLFVFGVFELQFSIRPICPVAVLASAGIHDFLRFAEVLPCIAPIWVQMKQSAFTLKAIADSRYAKEIDLFSEANFHVPIASRP